MRASWARAIVVGASSGIGRALAVRLASRGCRVAAVARREAELRDLAERHAVVLPYPHDVTVTEEVPDLFRRICRDLGGLDLVVYAAGIMPRLGPDEYRFAADRR